MIQRMAGLVAMASALLLLGVEPALASKEKFVRSKWPLGSAGQTVAVATGRALAAVRGLR
jgi:hypothetical protein